MSRLRTWLKAGPDDIALIAKHEVDGNVVWVEGDGLEKLYEVLADIALGDGGVLDDVTWSAAVCECLEDTIVGGEGSRWEPDEFTDDGQIIWTRSGD